MLTRRQFSGLLGYTDSKGRTARQLAVQYRHENVVSALPERSTYDGPGMVIRIAQGYRPLNEAAVAGDVTVVRDLLKKSSMTCNTERALVLISKLPNLSRSHLYVVTVLFSYGADPNANEATMTGTEMVLHFAAFGGHLDLIHLLQRQSKLIIHARGERGMNALHYAANGTNFRNAVEITKVLMAAGISISDPTILDDFPYISRLKREIPPSWSFCRSIILTSWT